MTNEEIIDNAKAWARANKKRIARELINKEIYPSEEGPVSIFMAGSPGAGKTEASKIIIASDIFDHKIIRIDADELRDYFNDYTGDNSHLFQGALSLIMDQILVLVHRQKQSFLLDVTMGGRYDIAEKNIQRSLQKNRKITLFYVYQPPEIAWKFVQKREITEGRRVSLQVFIDQYFGARANVNRLKATFGEAIRLNVINKKLSDKYGFYYDNTDTIDRHIPETYTKESLFNKLSGGKHDN